MSRRNWCVNAAYTAHDTRTRVQPLLATKSPHVGFEPGEGVRLQIRFLLQVIAREQRLA